MDVEADLLVRLRDRVVVPREEVVDGLRLGGLADAVAEDERGRAVAEDERADAQLLVLDRRVELGADHEARELAGDDEDARGLLHEARAECDVGGGAEGREAARAADAVHERALDGAAEAELAGDVVVVARVGGVGARRGDDVRDLRDVAAPLLDRLARGTDGEFDTFFEVECGKLIDRWSGAVEEGVGKVTGGITRVDACVCVDRKELLDPRKKKTGYTTVNGESSVETYRGVLA